jgi:hypothetical protein
MYCTRLPTHYLGYMHNNPSRLPTYQPNTYLPLAYLPTHLITLAHIVNFHVYKCTLSNAHVQIIKFTLTHCQGQIYKIIGAHCQVYKLFHEIHTWWLFITKFARLHVHIAKSTRLQVHTCAHCQVHMCTLAKL